MRDRLRALLGRVRLSWRDPLDLLRLALLAGAPVTLVFGPREQSFRLVLTFGLVLIPRLLRAPRFLDLAFLVGMSFQAWGNVFGAFDGIYAYDKVVHFLLPLATSSLLYLLLVRLRLTPVPKHDRRMHERLGVVLVAAAFGLAIGGGLYEIYEWFADRFLGAHLYTSYGDSIGDLTDDTFGSLLGGLLASLWALRDEPDESAPPPARRRRRPRLPVPGFLVTDWGAAVRDVGDVARLALLVGLGLELAAGQLERSVLFAATFLASLAVRALAPPRPFELAFMVAVTFQAWGNALGGQATPGYRTVTHALVALVVAPLLYLAAVRLRVLPELSEQTRLHQRAAIALTGFAFGFSAGILYELYEYVANHLLGASFPAGYGRLIRQLGVDGAGALGGAALLVAWDTLGWGTRRRLDVRRARALAARRRPSSVGLGGQSRGGP